MGPNLLPSSHFLTTHQSLPHPRVRTPQTGPVVWSVLTLLLLVELLAWAAYGVLGWALSPGWLWVWLLPLLVVSLWAATASPRVFHPACGWVTSISGEVDTRATNAKSCKAAYGSGAPKAIWPQVADWLEARSS